MAWSKVWNFITLSEICIKSLRLMFSSEYKVSIILFDRISINILKFFEILSILL